MFLLHLKFINSNKIAGLPPTKFSSLWLNICLRILRNMFYVLSLDSASGFWPIYIAYRNCGIRLSMVTISSKLFSNTLFIRSCIDPRLYQKSNQWGACISVWVTRWWVFQADAIFSFREATIWRLGMVGLQYQVHSSTCAFDVLKAQIKFPVNKSHPPWCWQHVWHALDAVVFLFTLKRRF